MSKTLVAMYSVIHMLSPSDLNECQTAVQAALNLAKLYFHYSIFSLPIGSGNGGLRCEEVPTSIASEMVSSARANSLGSITLVRLVAFKANKFTAFDSALNNAINCGAQTVPSQ